MKSWPRSEASRATVKFWGQSFSRGHYPPIYQQAERGFIYFITLRIISQGERKSFLHILWIFFVSRYEIVNQPFIYPSPASAKSPFQFSLTNLKFSVNVCWFFGFPSVEIKSDDGYQIGRRIPPDIHRPILYHVISFIQWEPSEIIRWVI